MRTLINLIKLVELVVTSEHRPLFVELAAVVPVVPDLLEETGLRALGSRSGRGDADRDGSVFASVGLGGEFARFRTVSRARRVGDGRSGAGTRGGGGVVVVTVVVLAVVLFFLLELMAELLFLVVVAALGLIVITVLIVVVVVVVAVRVGWSRRSGSGGSSHRRRGARSSVGTGAGGSRGGSSRSRRRRVVVAVLAPELLLELLGLLLLLLLLLVLLLLLLVGLLLLFCLLLVGLHLIVCAGGGLRVMSVGRGDGLERTRGGRRRRCLRGGGNFAEVLEDLLELTSVELIVIAGIEVGDIGKQLASLDLGHVITGIQFEVVEITLHEVSIIARGNCKY